MITLTQASAATSTRRGGIGGGVADQYYALAHWLRPAQDSAGDGQRPITSKSIGITSCVRGAGVSTTAVNLAAAAAKAGDQPVLLVDVSGTGSAASTVLGISGERGLTAALAGHLTPLECVTSTAVTNLSYLGGADFSSTPLSGIDGGRVVDLLLELERHFSFLVIDLPTTESGLCFSIAGGLDGVLLVIDAQRTQSSAAIRAKQRLTHANAAVLGIILNQHAPELPSWLDARL